LDYLTTHTNLSPIRRGFAPGFVNYKEGCTRLAVASDKVFQFLAHGRWFSSCTPASSTTKTGRHDIAEILLKVALNTKNQSTSQLGILFQRHSKIVVKPVQYFCQCFRYRWSYSRPKQNQTKPKKTQATITNSL